MVNLSTCSLKWSEIYAPIPSMPLSPRPRQNPLTPQMSPKVKSPVMRGPRGGTIQQVVKQSCIELD